MKILSCVFILIGAGFFIAAWREGMKYGVNHFFGGLWFWLKIGSGLFNFKNKICRSALLFAVACAFFTAAYVMIYLKLETH